MRALILLPFIALNFTSISAYSQSTVKGYVVTLAGDTVRGEILKAAKARDDRRLSFMEVTLVNGDGQSTRYVPGEIRAYSKGTSFFRNFSEGSKQIFAEQLTRGRVWLYFSTATEERASRYFFRRNDESDFLVIDANAPTPRRMGAVPQVQSNRNGIDIPIIADRDKAFKEYFSIYFKDCPKLSNKIKMDFYSRSDIKDIFVEYNTDCK